MERRARTLADLLARPPLDAWEGEAKIPWHEQGFSARMLGEHLSQAHDRASRRAEVIERHVDWIQDTFLRRGPARVLDLGCGPGLYAERLARRGHTVVGIDFSPASIEYAARRGREAGLAVDYRLADLRSAELGKGFDLVLLLFGELDTFAADEASSLLERSARALVPGGALVLEVHSASVLRARGEAPSSWFAAERSVFSDEPHLCLREAVWQPARERLIERWLVVSLASGLTDSYVAATRAPSESARRERLAGAGFAEVERRASLAPEWTDPALYVLTGRAPA